jgi:hypothetical protein
MTLKVALIDNMNNNFFAIARYLRDLGVDAHVYLIPGDSHAHFLPQTDTFADVGSLDWVRQLPLPYAPSSFYKLQRLRPLLEPYDLIVTCGPSVGLLWRAGIRTDVFVPYGADLYDTPFVERQRARVNGLRSLGVFLLWSRPLARAQFAGIRNSRLVIYNDNWSIAAEAMARIGATGLALPRLMVYNKEPPGDPAAWEFLRRHDFVVFSQTRQYWATDHDQLHDFAEHGGLKRNDKLIRAFARFVRATSYRSPLLVLFEFGWDVDASKRLIAECGIEANVVWMPLMDRKTIMTGVRFASLGADQFRHGWSGTSGGTGSEIMAAGVPLITYTNGASSDPKDPFFQAPICDVLHEDQIYEVLRDYERDPDKYAALGRRTAAWFDEHLGSGLAARYLRVFEHLAQHREQRVRLDELHSALGAGAVRTIA